MSFERLKDPRHIMWAKAVKDRDNYVCQVCKRYGIELHAHHLNGYNLFVEQRYDVNNGICLCFDCHRILHDIIKRGNNTKYQFYEFLQSYALIKRVLVKLNYDTTPEATTKESDGYL